MDKAQNEGNLFILRFFEGGKRLRTLLQLIPIPMSGVMLALVALGNLLYTYGFTMFSHISFFIGVVLFVLLLAKLLFCWAGVQQDMKNPIIASVSPTFTMGTMVMSSGLFHYHVNEAMIDTIWFCAVIGQFTIVIYFAKTFIWRQKIALTDIYPSWLIVFVGLAMIPLTAGRFSNIITQAIVLFAVIAFIILVPLIITRGFIKKDLPQPTIPMLTILAAPASLSLAAYLQQFEGYIAVVLTLLTLAQLLFLLVLVKMMSSLKLPFYPSYAAFTFPLVVTATAIHSADKFFIQHNMAMSWLTTLSMIELLIAAAIVCYVLVRYSNYILFQLKQNRVKQITSEEISSH